MERYRVQCGHCYEPVLTAQHLGDPELGRLRGHLSDKHPRIALVADAQAGAVLWHFNAEPAA